MRKNGKSRAEARRGFGIRDLTSNMKQNLQGK